MRENWRRQLFIAGVVLIVLLLGVLLARPALNLLTSTVDKVTRSVYSVSDLTITQASRLYCATGQELQDLQTKNSSLQSEIAKLQIQATENDQLRQQLNFQQLSQLKELSADVVSKIPDPFVRGVIIYKGSDDGVKTSQAVTSGTGILVGKIGQVWSNRSQVIFLIDHHSKVSAFIPAQKESSGLVEGQFGLGLRMSLIPMTSSVAEGQLVATAGLEDNLPAGLIIGTLQSITAKPTDLFKTAQVVPKLNYEDIRIVGVVTQ